MKTSTRNYKILLAIWLLVIGFLGILPLLWVRHLAGASWHGVIPGYITDAIFYCDRINITFLDFAFSGKHYFLEHRYDLQAVFSIAEAIVALPMKLGLSFTRGLLLGFFVLNFLFAWLTYKFLRKFVDFVPALVLASLACALSYGGLVRPVIMETVWPAFMLFQWAMASWLENPDRLRYRIWSIIALAGSFYLYSYLWQVALLNAILLLAFLFISKRRQQALQLFKIIYQALLLAAPAIFYALKEVSVPGYWHNMERVGFMFTHLPPIEAYYYGRWLLVAAAIWIIIFWRQLREWSVQIWYMLLGAIAILGALVSNIVTGKDFLIATHVNRFVTVWFGLMLGFAIYKFFAMEFWKGKRWQSAILIVLFIMGAANVLAELKRSIQPAFAISRSDVLAVQPYSAPIAWLDSRETQPVVVWADDAVSRYVPYLSKHYVLEPGLLNTLFYLMQDSEVQERYAVSRSLTPVSQTTLQQEYPSYGGAYSDYRNKDLSLRQRICHTLRLNITFCQNTQSQALAAQKERDIMAMRSLETKIRLHLQ